MGVNEARKNFDTLRNMDEGQTLGGAFYTRTGGSRAQTLTLGGEDSVIGARTSQKPANKEIHNLALNMQIKS